MVRHSSRIYLSQSALRNNINFLRKKIGSSCLLSAVVKANAYGHGIVPMTQMLENCGVNHFSVASAFEAEEVLSICSSESQIMIMGILYDEDIPWAVENDIEFYVYNYDRLEKVKEAAKKANKTARIHLEVETGTNRTGLSEENLSKAISWLRRNKDHVEFTGLCTHLGGAESVNNEFKILPQIDRYNRLLAKLKKRKFLPRYRHIACSAAALAYPQTRLDMVRIGVSVYGFWPSRDIYYKHLQDVDKLKDTPLKRIISWKTDIMDIKTVQEGEFVGYGTAFQALKNMQIAVLPLGYSNGFTRGLSNRGYVLIKGKKAPVVGLVNMNVFMVDVSHIKGVKTGDEVVLLGKQKNNVIKVSSFTDRTQLLNNELLSRLPAAIPREITR